MYRAHKRKTSNMLYALVRSEHKRFQTLSEFVSANTKIAQVVWQKIPHQPTTEKAHWAVVFSRQHGTTRSRWLADRGVSKNE